MKKVLLLVCAALSTILVNAQEKKYYPTVVLSEEMIKAKLQSAKVNGEDNAEIQSLKERLYAKLEEQQKEIKLHGSLVAKTLPPSVTSTGCVNPGFEDGTTNGWVLEVGDNSGAASLPCPTCFTGPGGVYAVTNSTYTDPNSTSCSCSNTSNCSNPPCTNGIDNYGGFPVTIGLHSLLINNTTCGNKMEKASYSFVVDNTNNSYTFSYAVVIQNGNTAGNSHAPGTQPYFHVDVTDNTTGSVIPCTQFDVEAPTSGNLNGFSHSTLDNTVYYKAWTSVTLDLTAAMTHSVTVSFTVSDCLYSGHFGYAYIDGACNQINTSNVAGICNGTNANLCGPPGYLSYSWTGPVSGSSQCLSTSTAGSYTLNLTSASACPPPVMHYSVTVAPAPTASFTINNPSCSLTINATDASSVSGGGTISNWSWDFGDGQTATSTTAGNTQAHTYTNTGTYTVAMTCTTSAGCVATYTLPVTITSLSVTATSSSVTCNGASTGSATVTATGGSGSFTYAWSPSGGTGNIASGLSAGSYSCVVSDGGSCNYTATVNVTQATPITSTKSITDAYCNLPDGGVTVTPSGGAGGYTYSWSGPGGAGGNTGTLSGVTAGVYTLTVHDSNNCTYTTTATINNLAGDSILSITTASVSCYNGTNGTANATTSGTGITYTWSPAGGNSSSASGLSPNTYTLYITDSHGCTDNASAIVGNATPVTATSTITATPCGGSLGSATVTPSGGTGPYTYTWSPAPASGNANNVQNLTSGGYNCVITDSHSCTYTTSIIITTTSGPTVTAVQTASVTCNGLSNGSASVTTISGGTAPYSYSWLPGPVSTTNTALGVPANTYSVIVTDNTGCIGLDTVTVYQPAPFSLPVVTGTVSCNNLNSTISPTLTTDGSAAVNGSGGTGAWTYTWTNSNNQVVSNSSSTGP
ncbi:MAG: PKD domain-containing protein, partial [Bacteroidia bacterium]